MPDVINNLATVQKNGVKRTEYWAKKLEAIIRIEQRNFVFTSLGKQVSLPRKQGTTTYSFKRPNRLPISATGDLTPLVEGQKPTALKVEFQKVQASVNQYGNYIIETDVVDAVGFDDVKKTYQPELAAIAAEEKELVTINSFADASERWVNGRVSDDEITATDTLTLAEGRLAVLTMRNAFRKGHAKYGGKFVGVVHVNVMQDLLDDATLLDNILVPGNENSPMKNGTLNSYQVYGTFYQETLVCPKKVNSEGVNVYTSVFLGQDPYAVLKFGNLEWKETGFEADKNDPLGQTATLGYKHWIGAKVIDPLAITLVYSASAYDDASYTTDTLGAAASQA